jgi:hypothetical protein
MNEEVDSRQWKVEREDQEKDDAEMHRKLSLGRGFGKRLEGGGLR